jgi:pilus assembly protein CpaE
MSYQVLLAVASPELGAQATALTGEDEELEVVGSVSDAGEVMAMVGKPDIDAVLLHEDVGPLPVLDLAREMGVRFPHVGVVLVVRDRTPEVLRAALQAGVRDVLSLPLSFEELRAGLRGAASWSRAVRDRISLEVEEPMSAVGGQMIAVAGAKGGVGATTIAVHLALETVRRQRQKSVCLIDFDLQAGDVGILLDLTHRRSVADLLDVTDELTVRQVEDAVYLHPSGLRVLLAPGEGEHFEDVSANAARRILGTIKSNFDVVIVDVGTTVTEANAVAVEMADDVLVVTTPDVPALRAANRLVALWERLQVRKEDIRLVANRVNKDLEVQPDLARRVATVGLTKTVLPAAFKSLEPAANTGVPDRLADGPLRTALVRLAQEVGVVPRHERRRVRAQPEAGQVTAETVGLVPIIAIIVVLLWEIVLIGVTYVLAGHASREAAHELSVGGEVRTAAEQDLLGPWRRSMGLETGDDWVEVRLKVPALFPGIVDSPWTVTSRSGTVVEES